MATDPLLGSSQHKATREWWRLRATHCAVCGIPLDLEVGSRSPRALDVGHIVGRHRARQLGWTDAQINDRSNTRPECRRCNRSAGARYRNARVASLTVRRPPRTSKAWG